ncbi:MAG: hypothetical protein M1815_004793 [Lichina confinis]|nr:MAG: hypothetical protein M1815_004793 [Lichina confinis]
MSSVVAELDAALQAMLALKPPGVSGSKINAITTLCTNNIQSESVIVQKIYTHFKRTPGTHKLGVLYVVDSVTRQWVDHARKMAQQIGAAAGDGTYAAGVNRVTELLPVLMADIVQHAPEDQKEKIRKLVDIWERGITFPAHMLASFKEKLSAPSNSAASTTPPGTPPTTAAPSAGPAPPTAPPPDTTAILEALANIAKQSASAPPPSLVRLGIDKAMNNGSSAPQPPQQPAVVPVSQMPAYPTTPQPVGAPSLASHFPGMNLNSALMPNAQPSSLAVPPPPPPPPPPQPHSAGGAAENLQQQLELIRVLMQQGIPQEQWGPILAALSASNANPAMAGMAGMAGLAAAGAGPAPAWPPPNQAGWATDQSRDQNRADRGRSSPPSRYRDRSRSPRPWGRERDRSPPRRRDSPIYGDYSGDSPGRDDPYERRGRGGRGGRGRDDYRQRSPPTNRRGWSPNDRDRDRDVDRYPIPPVGPKWFDYDPTIGKDNIKVYSRTLFVGGVTTNDDELRRVFSRFGSVQTCIVNSEKRHAFIKMISRKDAIAAKEGMERDKPPDLQLRTRWGVGFGPRDCSDYTTGISIIPIARLTEADRKWMLTAEFGGSGGKAIEGGLVVEEPDIEIGAGVSSKGAVQARASISNLAVRAIKHADLEFSRTAAISRRVTTDHSGGRRGARSNQDSGRARRHERPDGPDPDSVNAAPLGQPGQASGSNAAPALSNFPFPFANILPPGFILPGMPQQQQQSQQQPSP